MLTVHQAAKHSARHLVGTEALGSCELNPPCTPPPHVGRNTLTSPCWADTAPRLWTTVLGTPPLHSFPSTCCCPGVHGNGLATRTHTFPDTEESCARHSLCRESRTTLACAGQRGTVMAGFLQTNPEIFKPMSARLSNPWELRAKSLCRHSDVRGTGTRRPCRAWPFEALGGRGGSSTRSSCTASRTGLATA